MGVVILIPARASSKRVPNKNIRMIGNKMLMEYTLILSQFLVEQAIVSDAYLSSDSDGYLEIGKKYDVKGIKRPDSLAADDSGDYGVIEHFIKETGHTGEIVYLRPTTPFRSSGMIETAIKMTKEVVCSGLRSVQEMSESAYKCFELHGRLLLVPITHEGKDLSDVPNHLCPKTYYPNGYVDICRTSEIKNGIVWGKMIYGLVTPPVIEIDTEQDLEYAEYYNNRHPEVIYHVGNREMGRGKSLAERP